MTINNAIETIQAIEGPEQWICRMMAAVDENDMRVSRFKIIVGPNSDRTKVLASIPVRISDKPKAIAAQVHRNCNNAMAAYVRVEAYHAHSKVPADTRYWAEVEDGPLDDSYATATAGGSAQIERIFGAVIGQFMGNQQSLLDQVTRMGSAQLVHMQAENDRMHKASIEAEELKIKFWEVVNQNEDKRHEREMSMKKFDFAVNSAKSALNALFMYTKGGGSSTGTLAAALKQLLESLDDAQMEKLMAMLSSEQQTLLISLIKNLEPDEESGNDTETRKKTDDDAK